MALVWVVLSLDFMSENFMVPRWKIPPQAQTELWTQPILPPVTPSFPEELSLPQPEIFRPGDPGTEFPCGSPGLDGPGVFEACEALLQPFGAGG